MKISLRHSVMAALVVHSGAFTSPKIRSSVAFTHSGNSWCKMFAVPERDATDKVSMGSSVQETVVPSSDELATDEKRDSSEEEKITVNKIVKDKQAVKKIPKNKHTEGIFSPLVEFSKFLLGDEELKKLRAKAISMHSSAINSFVDTSSSEFGDAVLRALFKLADKNNDGSIQEEELNEALKSLGFDFLTEKQTKIIFKKVDADGSGEIDIDEWMASAPRILRANLMKLAKENGDEMGLLV